MKDAKAQALNEFMVFLRTNGVDEAAFTSSSKLLPRYLRLNPFSNTKISMRDLETQIKHAQVISRSRDIGISGDVVHKPEVLDKVESLLQAVPWLPSGMFSTPARTRLASTKAYRSGQVYGIDASSCAAVVALDPRPGDDVLDLCCAPGAKLCLISDLMKRQGSVTGVDINPSRLNICSKMLLKYGIADAPSTIDQSWRCRLFCADGTTFSASPYSDVLPDSTDRLIFDSFKRQTLESKFLNRKRKNKSWKSREMRENVKKVKRKINSSDITLNVTKEFDNDECLLCNFCRKLLPEAFFKQKEWRKRKLNAFDPKNTRKVCCKFCQDAFISKRYPQKKVTSINTPNTNRCMLYDKVLVDAECTHDGSIRHIEKFEDSDKTQSLEYDGERFKGLGWNQFTKKVLDPKKMSSLPQLQRNLLLSGFKMLKRGGCLIYSTCSLTLAQNEEVVQYLLDAKSDAVLLPINGCHRGCQVPFPTQDFVGEIFSSHEENLAITDRISALNKQVVEYSKRFNIVSSNTSGLFMAKITKK